jgi:signal transduction histidine kinase
VLGNARITRSVMTTKTGSHFIPWNAIAFSSPRKQNRVARMQRTSPTAAHWELAAEALAIKIRWFGIVFGCLVVNVGYAGDPRQGMLNGILALGAGFALLDTVWSWHGKVFLGSYPLLISAMEALFIGVLCFYQGGLESAFRHYYFLSLVCCAIRHAPWVTWVTCALHCLSYSLLYVALPDDSRGFMLYWLTIVVLVWVTWASTAMAMLVKSFGEQLERLNGALQENQMQLEARIAERTRELQESQAHVLHQEKMAAFGLLAAGIAHEVGNPLTSISSLVQILQHQGGDQYTQEKLALVSGQLQRIQTTLRELVTFSRPASTERGLVCPRDILQEALNVAKYYKRTRGRTITLEAPSDLPTLQGVRDQLVQVFLNLVLNAIDATARGGKIDLDADSADGFLSINVRDDGSGIAPEARARVFQPYFTSKKHGTGLGLFVTRKLVADHGGTIDYVSEPGRGTTFTVRLPVPVRAPASNGTSVAVLANS